MKKTEKIARIRQLLEAQSTLTLATTGPDGLPRSTPMFYLADEDLRLYWFSSSKSRHSLNLAHSAQAAVAIHAPTDNWKQILGLQATGIATPVRDAQLRQAISERYVERFRLGALFAVAVKTSTLYGFTPRWLRLTDNSVRFGFRFELEFPDTTK